ncbi:TniQ family protein [Gimibacter soli]|uniref:TniQ family protein n=1 Tax=Gimibacter soli TaxID=3024400 RepID=A0AAE9XWB8_9PROT|nr:TniQ family protein [Gimibacter soli]WCL55608.1 TniQ family protein [Gimibacter soli]
MAILSILRTKRLPFHPWPCPDETVSSWLSRLAGIYGYEKILAFLDDPYLRFEGLAAPYDLDRPLPRLLEYRLARLVGMPSRLLRQLALDGDGWVTATGCTAACPLCWLDDLVTGQPPRRRRRWMRATAWCCPRHRFPYLDLGSVPAGEAECRLHLEPLMFRGAIAAAHISAPVAALLRFEAFLAAPNAPVSLDLVCGLLDRVGRVLFQSTGQRRWQARLWLYRFEARGALPWELLFGSDDGHDPAGVQPSCPQPPGYLAEPAIGKRRQMAYALLDLLARQYRDGLGAVSWVTPRLRSGLAGMATKAATATAVAALSAFAARVMPSSRFDPVYRPVPAKGGQTDDG